MKTLIIANWKMNPQTLKEAKLLFTAIKKGIKNIKNVEVVICPPFVYLPELKIQNSKIKLGAQDCFWEEKGAFTGEISPLMLKNLNCEYVIVGHSERRKLGEKEEMVSKKLKAVLKVNLKPILCVGETLEARKKGKTFVILKNQLKTLSSLPAQKLANLILAYEPIWAIGTGISCPPQKAKEVLQFLRKFLKKDKIIYGGSVNSKNVESFIKDVGFDGVLVGGASLDKKEFLEIIKKVENS